MTTNTTTTPTAYDFRFFGSLPIGATFTRNETFAAAGSFFFVKVSDRLFKRNSPSFPMLHDMWDPQTIVIVPVEMAVG